MYFPDRQKEYFLENNINLLLRAVSSRKRKYVGLELRQVLGFTPDFGFWPQGFVPI